MSSGALRSSYLITSLAGTASSKPGTNSIPAANVGPSGRVLLISSRQGRWRAIGAGFSRMETAVMKVLKRAAVAAAYTASVAISFLVLLLCSACLLSGASLALIGMSALGSGLMALMEFRSSFKTIG